MGEVIMMGIDIGYVRDLEFTISEVRYKIMISRH